MLERHLVSLRRHGARWRRTFGACRRRAAAARRGRAGAQAHLGQASPTRPRPSARPRPWPAGGWRSRPDRARASRGGPGPRRAERPRALCKLLARLPCREHRFICGESVCLPVVKWDQVRPVSLEVGTLPKLPDSNMLLALVLSHLHSYRPTQLCTSNSQVPPHAQNSVLESLDFGLQTQKSGV